MKLYYDGLYLCGCSEGRPKGACCSIDDADKGALPVADADRDGGEITTVLFVCNVCRKFSRGFGCSFSK